MTSQFIPAYHKLLEAGKLEERVKSAQQHLKRCDLCGWKCGVDRTAGELGKCQSGSTARISSFGPHLGEEDPVRGWRGSGTIFLSGCNLSCQYCQNYDISQSAKAGSPVSPEKLAGVMLILQERGCHNINLVSPSHVVAQIISAISISAQNGLKLQIIYNTGGYDSINSLKLLDGIIDIYMPDMKYADPKIANRYSCIPNYPAVNQKAVLEMHRQVGDLKLDQKGIAQRGLLIRHLVLPNGLAGTEKIVNFLSRKVSANTYINIMAQYHPAYQADQFPELNRPITLEEYQKAIQLAQQAGIKRLDQRRPLDFF